MQDDPEKTPPDAREPVHTADRGRRTPIEVWLGVLVVLALAAGVLIVEVAGGLDFVKKGLRVRALFDSVQELKVGDPVKMGGVPIGYVSKIGFTQTNAQPKVDVAMTLHDPKHVKTDSTAVVRFQGLMGQNYVSVDFGSPGARPVEEGTILQSREQADLASLMTKLEDVADGVENLTREFSGDNLSNLLGPFTDFLRENRQHLSDVIANIRSVSEQIAGGRGTVGRLIQEEDLYVSAMGAVTNLNLTAEDLRAMIAQAQEIVTGLQNGRGTLGKLTTDEQLYSEALTAVANLKEILEKINQGEGSVGKLVNDETMFKNLKLTLQKVEKATEGLEDQGPMSVLGIAVNSLF